MIICKPRFQAISALVLFLVILYSIMAMLLYNYAGAENPSTGYYIGIVVILLLALPMTLRLFFHYKTIQVDKGRILIHYTLLSKQKKFFFKDLIESKEERIKTFNDEYKLLHLRFEDGFLEISQKEYTNYDRLKSHVMKLKSRRKR